jgi:hypothetical protein
MREGYGLHTSLVSQCTHTYTHQPLFHAYIHPHKRPTHPPPQHTHYTLPTNLAQHERIKHHREVQGGVVRHVKIVRALSEQVGQEGDLEDELAGDVPEHEGVDERRVASVRAAVQEVGGGGFGAEGEGSLWVGG